MDKAMTQNRQLEMLAAKYETLMFRSCCGYLHDADLAQDAVQEAFLKILKARPSFCSEQQEKAWVLRVTGNVCKDMLRTAWKRKVILVENPPEPTEDTTQLRETAGLVYGAVMQLKPIYRQVIVLHYFMGYPVKEIALALHAPQSTISVRLSRARTQLKSALALVS